MITGVLLPVLAAVAVLVLSGLYLVRLKLSARVRISLFCVRAALVTALALAFLQPTLHFSRIGRYDNSTLILIDNSRSMTLFSPDSVIKTLRRSIDHARAKTVIATFGDSLVRISSLSSVTFSASQTIFPVLPGSGPLRYPRKVLIVSDGNARDIAAPSAGFEDRDWGYLVLPAIHPRPFLAARAGSGSIESIQGKATAVPVQLTGYAPHRRRILVESATTGYVVHQVHELDSGFTYDTVVVSLTGLQPGRRLVTLRVSNDADSVTAMVGLIHTVVPDTLTVRVNAPAPDLDMRFTLLELKRAGNWKIVDAGRKPYDFLVTSRLDASVDSLVSGLVPAGIIVAIGVLPCSDAEVQPDPAVGTVLDNNPSPFFVPGPATERLPPLTSIARCRRSAGSSSEPNALLATVKNSRGAVDTVPMVYQSRLKSRSAIIVAARGFWRWDFLPLGLSEPVFEKNLFSTAVLAMARNRFSMNLSNRFIVIPRELPILASMPISFSVLVPATITEPTAGTVRILLSGRNGSVLDTTESIMVSGSAPAAVSIASLKPGRYLFQATLSAAGAVAAYGDSVSVEEDNAELEVMRQNTGLLGQLGGPVALNDSAVTAFLAAQPVTGHETMTETTAIPIRQSWWLFGIIGGVLALEWMLRRKWLVD